MTRRSGISLVEVLVAILITSVGLLALLTLFPLGALEMAQAVQDDRAGHIKHNAAATATVWNIRTDPDVTNAMLNPNNSPTPYTPGGPWVLPPPLSPRQVLAGPTLVPTNPASANMSSYPVLVDPNGYWANQGNSWQDWVAGGPIPGNPVLPRRVCCEPLKPNTLTPSPPRPPGSTMATDAVGRRQQLLQWTALLDDITFPRDVDYAGRPCLLGGYFDRAPRYSWAYLCRMPKAVANGPVYVSVIVYSGRALEQPTSGERAFSATFGNPGTNVISIDYGNQDPPDVSIGGWIFDATMVPPTPPPGTPGWTPPGPSGHFYRVVSVNQTGTIMQIEVQTPLIAGGGAGYGGHHG